MALLGSSVDPRLFLQDYSGFTRAAEIQAQGMQNLGQNIGASIEKVGDYFKQQNDKKKLIKQSDVQINAALKLFPDLAPTLQGVRDEIRDENIPLNDRAAIADSVAGLINMGTNQMRFQSEQGLQQQRLDIDRLQYESALERARSEQDFKLREAEAENNAAAAKAIGGLSALQQMGETAGKKFIPDEIATSINDLVASGQGKAAAGMIEKYSSGLSPALKSEFQTKTQGPIIKLPIPGGGTQTMRVEGTTAVPITIAPTDGMPVAGELIDVNLPPTAANPSTGAALQEGDVPRNAEKSGEVEVGGKKFDVYVDKNSQLVPFDISGIALEGLDSAPRDQWTHEKKYLVLKEDKPKPRIGPGTIGYTAPKEVQEKGMLMTPAQVADYRAKGFTVAGDPVEGGNLMVTSITGGSTGDDQTALQEKIEAYSRVFELSDEGKDRDAIILLNSLRHGGLLGGPTTLMDLEALTRLRDTESPVTPEAPQSAGSSKLSPERFAEIDAVVKKGKPSAK